jgi:phosphoribosyl-ATP pyrophosphohydrolase/phosphoribosyl-AMP cyclohydrolase/histidinol dehydrogenase
MYKYTVSSLSPLEHIELLWHPMLKFNTIIAKVKPIMDYMHAQGNTVLLKLTAKFNKAQLNSMVVFLPFVPKMMQLNAAVCSVIDTAYANIYKFHKVQVSKDVLVVKTMWLNHYEEHEVEHKGDKGEEWSG